MHADAGRIQWTDAHNHLHHPALRPWLAHDAPVADLSVVNATCEADWQDVAALARARPDTVCPAFGVHPWHLETAAPGWASRLRRMLDHFPRAGIGECGLDGAPRRPAMDLQIPVFREQLRIARETRRFLVVHCVKAWNPLLETLKHEPPPLAWMIHGYAGSAELARRFTAMGACFSISARALDPRRTALIETFRDIPPDRILLESDAPNLPPTPPGDAPHPATRSHPGYLAATGAALAARLGHAPDAFAALTRTNLLRMLAATPPLPQPS